MTDNDSTPGVQSLSERLRVGDCEVDIPLREIRAPDAPRPQRVTHKAIAVLLVLVEHAGKVVSRETLLSRVWPDTLPTDDVLTQAVTQLRKALAAERAHGAGAGRAERGINQQHIETIAKTGYRLRAPVAWLEVPAGPSVEITSDAGITAVAGQGDPAPAAARPSGTPAPAAGHRRGLVIAASAALALVLAISAFLLLSTPAADHIGRHPTAALQDGEQSPYELLTSAPGFELSPALSPDAAMVAYSAPLPGRRGSVILVQATDQSRMHQASNPADGVSDRVPAWSPDGREIAFVRTGPFPGCQIMVVDAGGGDERKVGSCDPRDLVSFDWSPDGRSLIFGSMNTARGVVGLRVLDLASGVWRPLAYDSASGDLDHAPRYSPDGRWIVFVRNPQRGDLWRVAADGGRAERLTWDSGEISGSDWLPDGSALVFSRRVGHQTRMFVFDLETKQVRDLGIEDARAPSVAGRAGTMAFVRGSPRSGIFRIQRSAVGQTAPLEPLFASQGRDAQPRIAPDGRQLVFTSDRSGEAGLWWANLRQPGSLAMIKDFRPGPRSLSEWSTDSRSLLIAGTDGSGRAGIHEVVPSSGEVTLLPVPLDHPVQASHLPGSQRMLVTAQSGDGAMSATVFDRSQQPWRAVAMLDDVSSSSIDHDNARILFTRVSADGLWQADLTLSPGSVRRVDTEAPRRRGYRSWAVDGEKVAYLDSRRGCPASLRPISDAADASVKASHCLHPDRPASTAGFSVDATSGAIFVALEAADGTDVAFMPVPTSAGTSESEPKEFSPRGTN